MESVNSAELRTAPILLNLSGDFFQPTEHKTLASSVTGDLRLAELDAFLQTLHNALEGVDTKPLDEKLEGFLVKVSSLLNSKFTKASVILEVSSVIKPITQEMVYTFKFNIEKDDSII